MNRFDIKGKKAIVTGGTRGLGHGMAEGLLEEGCEVVIVGSSEGVHRVAEEFRSRGFACHGVQADLGSREQTLACFHSCMELLGGDLLQRRQAALKIQNRAGESSGLALPHHLLTEGGGRTQSIKILIGHHHQAALGNGSAARPKQMRAAPDAVGQVSGHRVPPLELAQLLRLGQQDEGIFRHKRLPLVQNLEIWYTVSRKNQPGAGCFTVCRFRRP